MNDLVRLPSASQLEVSGVFRVLLLLSILFSAPYLLSWLQSG